MINYYLFIIIKEKQNHTCICRATSILKDNTRSLTKANQNKRGKSKSKLRDLIKEREAICISSTVKQVCSDGVWHRYPYLDLCIRLDIEFGKRREKEGTAAL